MHELNFIPLPNVHIKNRGAQLDILTGDIETEFGLARSAWCDDCLLFLGFYDGDEVSGWFDLKKRFTHANWSISNDRVVELYRQFCHQPKPSAWIIGTEFQMEVWQAICQIPEGNTVSYSQLAVNIKKPKAVRAIGSALGANNIAYWVPCHRAVRSDGSLGGYRWGLSLKAKMLSVEATGL